MRNTGLDKAQAGIKIAGININNLRYTDDTSVMTESEEKLKNLLKKVKEESEKAGLKLNIQKTNIMASSPTISWQIDGETMETVRDFIFCQKGAVICISEVIDISPGILIPACASSSPTFHMMYSAFKLNKQHDNIQP